MRALWCLLLVFPAVRADELPSHSSLKQRVPETVSEAIRDSLRIDAVRVSQQKQLVSFWLRRDWPLKAKATGHPSPETLRPGSLIGMAEFTQPWLDFRGQEVPAGAYTLRFARQPKSADHEDTSPTPDFLILAPAGEDRDPADLSFAAMKKLSGKATGGTHPVAMLMTPAGKRETGVFRLRESWVGLQWDWHTAADKAPIAVVVFGVWNGK